MRHKTLFYKTLVPFVLAFLGYCATSRATITDSWWHDDGDGAIVCSSWTFNNSTLTMSGDQYWEPGHMLGWVDTDTATDPTLTLASGIDNDTAFAWIGYQVNVIMPNTFSFVGTPSVQNFPLSDWSVTSVAAPTLQVSGIYAGDYEGTMDFAAGTPVGIGGELDFSYAIHFTGATEYSFTQEMIPTEVPEPNELGLASGLLFGGFELVKRLRKKT
jgi:hypothetical protein